MGRCNWSSFVERQKAKLEKEIRQAREALQAINAVGTDLGADAGAGAPRPQSEEDVAELERTVERMDDWKDLTRYSGKSVSMATARRGNEMKIHVMAFAEREDGAGVDFMRLSYRKSVE